MQSSGHYQDLGRQQENSGFSEILVRCHLFHVIMLNVMENNPSLASLALPPPTPSNPISLKT